MPGYVCGCSGLRGLSFRENFFDGKAGGAWGWRNCAIFPFRSRQNLFFEGEQDARDGHDENDDSGDAACSEMEPEESSADGHGEADISNEGSGIGPAAQQVVVDAGELHAGGMVGNIVAYALDGHVQVEEQSALGIFAHHALNPEK